MTRHARIKSIHQKASFNKNAEDSTPWEELKRPVEASESEDEIEQKEEIKPAKSEPPKFVPVNTSWSEIEIGDKSGKSKKKKNKNSNDATEVNSEDQSEVKSRKKKNKKKEDEQSSSEIEVPSDEVIKKKKSKRKSKDSELSYDNEPEVEVNVKKDKKNKKKKALNDTLEGCRDIEPESNSQKRKLEENIESDKTDAVENKEVDKKGKRRKTEPEDSKIIIEGEEVTVSRFEGFPVLETDKNRLMDLKKKLEKQNIPRDRIFQILKKERRMAEKKLSKFKKTLCFNCRGSGHSLTECPKLTSVNQQPTAVGICYKCGSTEHTLFQCKVPGNDLKFATCFICKEQGHLSKNCPDNPKGLYPQGGGCRFCGDVTHYREDCPKNLKKKEVQKPTYTVSTFRNPRLDNVEDDLTFEKPKEVKKDVLKPKKIYFN